MRSSSSSYSAASERRFSSESIDRLAKHDLFDFQIQQSVVSVRVLELKELLLNGRDEPDLADLLDQFIHELEDEIHGAGGNELFLLAALQHFRQQMEWCLEVDQDARMAATGVARNIFAPTQSKAKQPSRTASPVRKAATKQASIASPRAPRKKARGDEEIVCGVCFQPDSLEHDPIVICDLCGTAVHQSCYRIEDVPEDDWYCHPCQRYLHGKDIGSNVTPTHELECQACRFKGGAFIATATENWVHMACSMYLPELFVQTSHHRPGEEVIGGIELLNNRRQLRCCFCKKKNRGACAQCCVGKCATSYHVLCALQNQTRFTFMDDNDQFGSACTRHFKGFYGHEPPASATATDEAPIRGRGRPSKQSTAQQPATTTKRSPLPGKKRLLRPQNNSDSGSDEDEDDDGILLDEESDNSSMFSSDVESEATPQRKKASPLRPVKAGAQSTNPPPPAPRTASPAKHQSPKRGRPPKKQQTLMVPAFGIVKQLNKPSAQPATPILAPPVAPRPSPVAVDMKTQVLIPVGAGITEFQDVLILIPRLPLGLSLRTEIRAQGYCVVIQGLRSETTNHAVIDALRRGILCDGDQIVAVNDVSVRNGDIEQLRRVLAQVEPPFRLALATKSKRSLPQNQSQQYQPLPPPPPPPAKPVAVAEAKPSLVQQTITVEPPAAAAAEETTPDRTPMEEALSIDWPWFYLRSDGKLAMTLMWKSLEAGFFVPKMDPTTTSSLLDQVETRVGFRLRQTHPEYASTTASLLQFPSREHPVPAYIREFRDHKKHKRRSLANDSVFLDVDVEQPQSGGEEGDDRPPLAVGATVHVAKRTWPGINKLGGAGRIKKVHEVLAEDGGKKRFLYDVQYVLGGGEKKVERRWIRFVPSLNEDESGGGGGEERSKGSEATTAEADETTPIKLRVGMRLSVADDEAELPVIATRSAERKVQVTVTVLQSCVSLERKSEDSSREMLWHQHFPVKQSGAEALLSDALAGSVEYVEELGEDGEEEDEEEEGSEVAVQLRQAQEQFQRVMERNDALFTALHAAVESEYRGRGHRHRKLMEIQGRHYENMYRELEATWEDESEDEDTVGENENKTERRGEQTSKRPGGAHTNDPTQTQDSDSESDADDSCGGMFINRIKQEGNEVCVLCELTGGDFAATACGRVVHPQCAMYTPETFFKDGVAHGLDKIPMDERRALTCAICGGKKGLSKIQCANQRCLVAYHVACAFVNGQLTRDPHYQAWCPKHLKTSGMQGEIEWPPHLKPKAATPRGGGAAEASSSGKKKRRRSTGKSAENKEENDPREQLVVDGSVEEKEEEVQTKRKAPRRG